MIATVLPLALFVGVVWLAAGLMTGAFTPTVRAVLPPDTCPVCQGPAGVGHQCGGAQ